MHPDLFDRVPVWAALHDMVQIFERSTPPRRCSGSTARGASGWRLICGGEAAAAARYG